MQWCISISGDLSGAVHVPLRALGCPCTRSASAFRFREGAGKPHARPGNAIRVDELDARSLHDAADSIGSAAVGLGQATLDAVQGPQGHAAFSCKPRHRPI